MELMPPVIPVEILDAIFDFLSDRTSDLKTCSLVSHAWHAAAARILFSELHLLCSLDHPNPPALPQSKRRFDLAYGIFPVYRKKWFMEDTGVHCICGDNQDRTIQSFCSNGTSSMVNITSNVATLKLMFCRSDHSPLESVSNGPHSLQLYPDSTISTLLQLIDELSFVHLRFLTIDSAPQVLYFMICEPFSGVLSSAPSLEEIKFTSFESMQNSDIKRLLNKHAFSCTRFPRLRRIVFQGLFGTNTSGPYGPRMSCALELTRTGSTTPHNASPSSISVRVSYSSHQDALVEPDGFLKFELPGWCCFSGLCKNLQESKSLVDVMSLGSGFKDWSLPTIGIVLGAFQSDTLGHFARTLAVKVSSDVNDPSGTKLFALQEVVLVVDMHDTSCVGDPYHRTRSSHFDFQAASTLNSRSIERELEIMFPRVRAASPNFLTVQIM
ncbi:hypothetical protein LENED_000113 [Lentinula edodes]|uniref:F-box domain-containing protein n=1 Tax=Lentinula edodes TaxID=5353 RepID=A0A1Q3DUR9_LENED|nr:hypothetical protein LENED_000113 [Lentinula edodes]